jgi:tRNA-dihydrouridine synthase 4
MSILDVFDTCRRERRAAYIEAPMVRHSKLPFRLLCRRWGCDIVYTPMIMAGSFVKSHHYRDIEMLTTERSADGAAACFGLEDWPLVVQFAASNVHDFAQAAALVSRDCSAVDINCGCPQKWAVKEGIGCALMKTPQFVHELVRTTRNQAAVPVAVKCRILDDERATADWVQQVAAAGPVYMTVHCRTPAQRSSHPAHWQSAAAVKAMLPNMPVVLNGDVFTLDDAQRAYAETGCDGVMAARGLMENPALFQGCAATPLECVRDYVHLAGSSGERIGTMTRTLMYMLHGRLAVCDRQLLCTVRSLPALVAFLHARGLLQQEWGQEWGQWGVERGSGRPVWPQHVENVFGAPSAGDA